MSKVTIINPNPVGNRVVPTEDLSIAVDLETFKRGRSVVNVARDLVETSAGGKVTFIDGPTIGNKKSLTTNYTDITTTFSKNANELEGLGIKNIEIEFNSSYAPMIKIDFTDVRGSSIMELGNKSKYNVFFELPYPIFKLTVKGFYGKAVTYCLHMTRWNSSFDDKTGNFNITANFIGYTYAFLTDMLVGYLRAIVETKRGAEKFKEIQRAEFQRDPAAAQGLITLNELMVRVKEIETAVEKLSQKNDSVRQLAAAENSLNNLRLVLNRLNNLGKNLYAFNGIVNSGDGLIVIRKPNEGSNQETTLDATLQNFKKEITDFINDINKSLSNSLKLNTEIFDTINKLDTTLDNESSDELNDHKIFDTDTNILFVNLVSKRKKLSGTQDVSVYNLLEAYSEVENKIRQLSAEIGEKRISVNDELKKTIKDVLRFDPTIENMFKILSTHVDVLRECIKEVGQEAENNQNRQRLLSSVGDSVETTVFPFPEYREVNPTTGQEEEAWIGNKFPTIDEAVFIEELINGLIEAKTKDNLFLKELSEGSTGWYPVNPLDTPVMNVINPFEVVSDTIQVDDIVRLVGFRAMTFLGYTVRYPGDNEIRTMAKLDANNAFNNILNAPVKTQLSTLGGNTDVAAVAAEMYRRLTSKQETLKISNGNSQVFHEQGPSIRYDYDTVRYGGIFKFMGDVIKEEDKNYILANYSNILPISKGSKGGINETFYNGDGVIGKSVAELKDFAASNNIYLSQAAGRTGGLEDYPDDGAVYIRLLTNKEYSATNVFPDYANDVFASEGIDTSLITPDSILNTKSNINWNNFGGQFGTQEYRVMTNSDGVNIPSWLLFYKDYKQGLGLFNVTLPTVTSTTRKKGEDGSSKFDIGDSFTVDMLSQDKDSVLNLRDAIGQTRDNILSMESFPDRVGTPWIAFNVDETTRNKYFTLFGSELYFYQNNEHIKALMFLHCLPFNGLVDINPIGLLGGRPFKSYWDTLVMETIGGGDGNGVLPATLGQFNERAGFVQTPHAWLLILGGLLWKWENATFVPNPFGPDFRADNNTIWEDSNGNSLIPFMNNPNNSFVRPTGRDYFTYQIGQTSGFDIGELSSLATYGMAFSTEGRESLDIEDTLTRLPLQVRNTLIKNFEDWVASDSKTNYIGWRAIANELEIFLPGTTVTQRNQFWDDYANAGNNTDNFLMNSNILNPKLIKNYHFLARDLSIEETAYYINDPGYYTQRNFQAEIRDKSDGSSVFKRFLTDSKWVLNSTYRIWEKTDSNLNQSSEQEPVSGVVDVDTSNVSDIVAKKSDFELYLSSFAKEFIDLTRAEGFFSDKEEIKNQLFNTIDDDKIKLNVYRNIKAIYDKWLGGTEDILSLCGRNPEDSSEGLIGSFRFLDRAFNEIGQEFYVNPFSIVKQITGNYNQSFYDVVGRVLVDNNFDFIPLPTYINFRDEQNLKDMFKPFNYNKLLSIGDKRDITSTSDVIKSDAGPTFICMYVGQRSKSLDLGSGGKFDNDGFDFISVDTSGKEVLSDVSDSIPSDIGKENSVAVFAVNYGRQNQSIFKSIKLDQSEFSETDETLTIIDDISMNGAPTNKTLAGQNLFNLWSKRSYAVEIEAMGNPMIQPMMYFQLNGIPMFHGGYMILRVNHSIKPHYMTTKFKGVRINKIRTPLIEDNTMFMNLIGSLGDVDVEGIVVTKGTPDSMSTAEEANTALSSAAMARVDIDRNEVVGLDLGNPSDTMIISSYFGPRNVVSNPAASTNHRGIDVAIPVGTPVKSSMDGVIEFVRLRDGYGLHIQIRQDYNGKRFRTVYAHLSEIDSSVLDLSTVDQNALVGSGVILNKPVRKGEIIGKSGGGTDDVSRTKIKGIKFAGTSTGAHLHFEVRIEEPKFTSSPTGAFFNNSTAVDPMLYIEAGRSNDTRFGQVTSDD